MYHFPVDTEVELRIYANSPFMTYDGQLIPAGSPNSPNSWYLPVACEIHPQNILYIPSYEIDATEDSPTDRSATYTAWLFANGSRVGTVPFLAGFGIPALLDPLTGLAMNQRWTSLILHRDAKNPPPREGVYDIGQVEYLITQGLALLRIGSETQVGMVALSVDPIDPSFPIALGANDPRVGVVGSAVGATGTDTLVAGTATTIADPLTALDSPINAIPMSDGITGNLRVSNRVAGVGFDVSSDNGADGGDFRWFRY